MGNGISDVLRTLYNYNGGEITVTLLYGTKHKVNLSNDGEYLYSITGLGKSNHLKLEWFDKIVKYIVDNGAELKRAAFVIKKRKSVAKIVHTVHLRIMSQRSATVRK